MKFRKKLFELYNGFTTEELKEKFFVAWVSHTNSKEDKTLWDRKEKMRYWKMKMNLITAVLDSKGIL